MKTSRCFVFSLLVAILVFSGSSLIAGDKKVETKVLSSVELAKLRMDDSDAFEKEYSGKAVSIEGLVIRAGTAYRENGEATKQVTLEGYQKPGVFFKTFIQCEDFGPEFEGIRMGHKVKVQGIVMARRDSPFAPKLRDCKVLKVFADDYPPTAAVKEEIRLLQGWWEIVRTEVKGKELEKKKIVMDAILIKGHEAVFLAGRQHVPYGLVPVVGKTPKALDIIGLERGDAPCIYTLEGDKLTLTVPLTTPKVKATRPTSHDTATQSTIRYEAIRQPKK